MRRLLRILALIAAAPTLVLVVPASAPAQDVTLLPGQRVWNDPATTSPYVDAARRALVRLYPNDERVCGEQGAALLLADDLGVYNYGDAVGQPVPARATRCALAFRADIAMSALRHYGGRRWLCVTMAHELAHAELRRGHTEDPADLMFGGRGVTGQWTATLPECDAAFPPYPVLVPEPEEVCTPPACQPPRCFSAPGWVRRSSERVVMLWESGRRHGAHVAFAKWRKKHPRRARVALRAPTRRICY